MVGGGGIFVVYHLHRGLDITFSGADGSAFTDPPNWVGGVEPGKSM